MISKYLDLKPSNFGDLTNVTKRTENIILLSNRSVYEIRNIFGCIYLTSWGCSNFFCYLLNYSNRKLQLKKESIRLKLNCRTLVSLLKLSRLSCQITDFLLPYHVYLCCYQPSLYLQLQVLLIVVAGGGFETSQKKFFQIVCFLHKDCGFSCLISGFSCAVSISYCIYDCNCGSF